MLWFLIAVIAHVANAVVFAVDKSLLQGTSRVGSPLCYTFYSSLLAATAVVLLPFSYAPLTAFILVWSCAAGVVHIIALLLFFSAVKVGEPSRVVPIAGSAVPLFTLLLAPAVIGEVLTGRQLVAVVLLIAGGGLLSLRRISVYLLLHRSALPAVAAGLFFAIHLVLMKFLYTHAVPFLALFTYSRLLEAVVALVILGPLMLLYSPARGGRTRRLGVPATFLGNKALAAGAFLLQNYAISLGSVTIVNALQGVQYLFLFALAIVISRRAPHLFHEELDRAALLQRLVGIVSVVLGLAFLV